MSTTELYLIWFAPLYPRSSPRVARTFHHRIALVDTFSPLSANGLSTQDFRVALHAPTSVLSCPILHTRRRLPFLVGLSLPVLFRFAQPLEPTCRSVLQTVVRTHLLVTSVVFKDVGLPPNWPTVRSVFLTGSVA